MEKYIVSLAAIHPTRGIHLLNALVEAYSVEEANGQAMEIVLQKFPRDKGWVDHSIKVVRSRQLFDMLQHTDGHYIVL